MSYLPQTALVQDILIIERPPTLSMSCIYSELDYNGNVSAQIAYTADSERWQFPASYYKQSFSSADGVTMDLIMIDTGNQMNIVSLKALPLFFMLSDSSVILTEINVYASLRQYSRSPIVVISLVLYDA